MRRRRIGPAAAGRRGEVLPVQGAALRRGRAAPPAGGRPGWSGKLCTAPGTPGPSRAASGAPSFTLGPGENSNKSCPGSFITPPARADSPSAQPGAAVASPRALLRTSRATPRVRAALGARPVAVEAPGALRRGAQGRRPGAPRRRGARTYLYSAGTGGLSAASSFLGNPRAGWWRRSLALSRGWSTPKPGS